MSPARLRHRLAELHRAAYILGESIRLFHGLPLDSPDRPAALASITDDLLRRGRPIVCGDGRSYGLVGGVLASPLPLRASM
jgi:hypothetical protein